MQRDKRVVEASLLTKGFQKDDRHHTYFIYTAQSGKLTSVRTKTSHGSAKTKAIQDVLLGQMARQCKLEKRQFLNLIDCPFTRDEYEAVLKENGFL